MKTSDFFYELPEKLINTSLSKLTKEEYDSLQNECTEIKQKIEYITNTTTVDMYINDLNELRKELEKDFK